MFKKITTLVCFMLALTVQAQDMKLYKHIVKDLSKSKFEGRGYVNDGVRKAETYLAEQYRNAGVDKVILQAFSIDINTFPGEAKMSVDGKKLTPGTQFVIREYSPGVHGSFPLYYVDTANYDFEKITADLAKPENKGCFVVVDFWFPYKHGKDFRQLEIQTEFANTGMLYTWETPLKFYKAYGETVWPKPILWASSDFPKDAKSITVDIDHEFRPNYKCNNVIAKVEGQKHDSTIVFIAHYDHLGHLGKDLYFPGTNDNASGNAALVTLAKHYAQNRPEYDMLFISVAGEEANLRGSTFFVEHPTVPLESIKYLINLDMIGDNNPVQYCEVSEQGMKGFAEMEAINAKRHYFQSLNRGELAANSDHYPFAEKGVPCIFYENEEGDAFQYYHTANDTFEHFYFETYELLFKLITEYIGD